MLWLMNIHLDIQDAEASIQVNRKMKDDIFKTNHLHLKNRQHHSNPAVKIGINL